MTVPIPQEPGKPGPPTTAWSPSLVIPSVSAPFYTGHLVLHEHHKVWYTMAAMDAWGLNCPGDAVALESATPGEGAPDLAAKVQRLEQMVEELTRLIRGGTR
jgi:hypothetical protein